MDEVGDDELDWIRRRTAAFGTTLATAIPDGFAVYGVLDVLNTAEQDLALLEALSTDEDVLVTGVLVRDSWREQEPGDDRELYAQWRYRFRRRRAREIRTRVVAGIAQDAWILPEILFPEDRRWMVSTLWDDSWRSIGCTAATAVLIERVLPEFERLDRDLDLRTTGRELS